MNPKHELSFPFWRRICALYIDLELLGLISLILGLVFWDFFAALGEWGELIGFSLGVVYFGFFNSQLGKGQTLGKRITKIRVISRQKKKLVLSSSLIRASILSGTLILFTKIPIQFYLSEIINFFTTIVLVFTLYLFLFNFATGQVFHDLIVGSYVISNESKLPVKLPTLPRKHLRIAGVLALSITLIFLSISYPIDKSIKNSFSSENITSIQQDIRTQVEEISSVDLRKSTDSLYGQTQISTLEVIATLNSQHPEWTLLSSKIAKVVFQQYPRLSDFDTVVIKLYSGYLMFFSKGYQISSYRYCPNAETLRLDQEFDRYFVLKTPGIFELIWNRTKSYPVFVRVVFFSYGSDPSNPNSKVRTETPIGKWGGTVDKNCY